MIKAGGFPFFNRTSLERELVKKYTWFVFVDHLEPNFLLFCLSKNLMRPYGGKHLTLYERVYNYRLCKARRYIECIMANKWRILHWSLNVALDLAEDLVKAICVLHNYVRVRDGYAFEDTLLVPGLLLMEHTTGGPCRIKAIKDIRDKFAEYYVLPEEVSRVVLHENVRQPVKKLQREVCTIYISLLQFYI